MTDDSHAGPTARNEESGASTSRGETAASGQPGLRELLAWLTSITRPVHGPLYISTLLRIVNLSLDVLMFALAVGAVTSILTEGGSQVPVIAGIVTCALLKAVCRYGEQLTGHYVAFKALELLRTMAFSQLWPKAPAIVARSRSGDLLASLTRDVDRIEVVYAHTFAPVVSAVVVPTAFLAGAGLAFGWGVVAVPAICMALALIVVPFLGLRRSIRATHRTLALRRELTHHVTDSVFGAEEIVAYGRQRERIAQMDGIGRQVATSAGRALTGAAIRRASNLALSLVAVMGAVWGSAHAGLSIAVAAGLAGGTLRLFEGPRGVEGAAGYIDHCLAAARRLWGIFHAEEAVADGPAVYEPGAAPSIEFSGVTYAYPEGGFGLDDVSFSVAAGGHLVLVGPSGSGKTTAASLLLRYDDPAGGHILLDDVPIQRYTLDSLRSAVVAVPQRNELLNSTIGDNLRLGRPHAEEQELWQALEAACLADEVRSMPQGLDTAVGQAGSRLSGGQAARLCLARALLVKPRVLILDEFAASLNGELEAAIRRNLASLARDMTIVEVTHRLDSAAGADVVAVFDRGRVVAAGCPTLVGPGGGLDEFFHRG
ncbi:MAG: ABC transporter ATP-binding protein [Actinomycetaceae bacterium]|nr:ABC transporter ATP-binding protein [Actinomycetaceae bacterium]